MWTIDLCKDTSGACRLAQMLKRKKKYSLSTRVGSERGLWSQIQSFGHLSLLRNTIYLKQTHATMRNVFDEHLRDSSDYSVRVGRRWDRLQHLPPAFEMSTWHNFLLVSSEQREQQVSAAERYAHRRALTHRHQSSSTGPLGPDFSWSRGQIVSF